ncbi:unnamed protein product [Schistosoma haematobium]|uniref:Uncharacterized protein n=1 Tax=Schistosoma haematobium TaxID=6185 RepID=A0A095ASR4_SCHHA|nr:unnamed protein product [Schistosoma haematobium]
MLSRNTTKTSLQGSSRIDSLLSTELIDLCNNNNGGSSSNNNNIAVKNDPLAKLDSTSVTVKQTVPYLTTDPYLEPVSLKRRQQQEKQPDNLIVTKKINLIDHYNDMDLDTAVNKNGDLFK